MPTFFGGKEMNNFKDDLEKSNREELKPEWIKLLKEVFGAIVIIVLLIIAVVIVYYLCLGVLWLISCVLAAN